MHLVVTGSSTGIGRELALSLLASGHQVWGLARSEQAELAERFPGRFQFSRCDVADWSQVQATAAGIEASWGHLDGLVACAGIQGEIGPALAADPLQWSHTVHANLSGTYFPIRALGPLMLRTARRAKIVCLSGGGATKARPNFSAYAAAKTGLVRMVETIAEENRLRLLDINAIAPGAINTRMTDEVIALGPEKAGRAEYEGALNQKQQGGASLSRVTALVGFLLSAQSDGVSGRLLSAPWDPWETLAANSAALAASDVYTLRRILPEERGLKF